jgi:uncharacterized membrane protein
MKTFLNGLSLIIPTALVFYIFLWILEKTEIFFKDFLLYLIPSSYYLPGMGLLAGFVFVYLIGLLLKFWIVQKVRDLIEKLINEMPIISSIYGGIKDFFNFFSNLKEKGNKITVLVDIPSMDAKVLGLITLEDFSNFKNLEMEEPVLVYIQMSYQVGGYSLFIPRKNLTPIDMNIENSMRFIMTAGISSKHENKVGKK